MEDEGKGNYVEDIDSEQSVSKIDVFMDSCANSNVFSLDMMQAIVDSLMSSNLQKISVKGGKKFRLEDDHVIYLTEALMKSNIQLVDLSLTYHKITGYLANCKLYFYCILFIISIIIILLNQMLVLKSYLVS